MGAAGHSRVRAKLVAPSAGTPEEPWLRTGDLGFLSDGELFIIGRIEDEPLAIGEEAGLPAKVSVGSSNVCSEGFARLAVMQGNRVAIYSELGRDSAL